MADYKHARKVWKNSEIKDLGQDYDLYVQSDTLLLADVFLNFRSKGIVIYDLDPAHFSLAVELAYQACLRKYSWN